MRKRLQKRRWLTAIAIACIAGLIAGCSAGQNNPDPANAATATPTGQSSKPAAEAQGPLELTWMAILYTTQPPSDVVTKEIEKLTNTKLNITWIPDAVKEDKINIALASGSLAKIVTIPDVKNSAYINAAKAGMFWEIGPFLKEFPNLAKANEQILNNISIGGKVFGIYRERDLSRQGITIRKDWLDSLGLQKPTNLEQLYNVMKAFSEQDPDGNGKDDTIGLSDRNDPKFGIFKTLLSYHGAPTDWGEKDGKLLPEFMFPEYAETMKYVKRLYDEKILNQDFAVTSKQQQWDYFTNGQAGVYIGNMDDSRNLRNTIADINPDARLDLINRIDGPDGQPHIWSQPGHNGIFVFPKSQVKDEAELKRILAFFDQMATPEGHNYLNLGIEGVHYKKPSADTFELISEADEAREIDVRPLQSLQGFYKETLKPAGDELRALNEQLNDDNAKFAVANPAEPLESSMWAEKGNELTKIVNDALYQYLMGDIDEAGWNKEIDKWKAQGGNSVIEEYNAAYASAGR